MDALEDSDCFFTYVRGDGGSGSGSNFFLFSFDSLSQGFPTKNHSGKGPEVLFFVCRRCPSHGVC